MNHAFSLHPFTSLGTSFIKLDWSQYLEIRFKMFYGTVWLELHMNTSKLVKFQGITKYLWTIFMLYYRARHRSLLLFFLDILDVLCTNVAITQWQEKESFIRRHDYCFSKITSKMQDSSKYFYIFSMSVYLYVTKSCWNKLKTMQQYANYSLMHLG